MRKRIGISIAVILSIFLVAVVPMRASSATGMTLPDIKPNIKGKKLELLSLGTTGPGAVYVYAGGKKWIQLGENLTGDKGSVTDIVTYDKTLFAAVTTNTCRNRGVGQVYWWNPLLLKWELVGDNLDDEVCTLAVYDGDLYAGTSYGVAKLYRYEGPGNWVKVVRYSGWDGFEASYVWNGKLYLGDSFYDKFGYYDGTYFVCEACRGGSCVYDFEEYKKDLYAGAYMGSLYKRDGGLWNRVPSYYRYAGLFELETYKDLLYLGQRYGYFYRYNGSSITKVYEFPDSVVAMAEGYDALYIGIGQNAAEYEDSCRHEGIAEVYKLKDGSITKVSEDDEFGDAAQVLHFITPRFLSKQQ